MHGWKVSKNTVRRLTSCSEYSTRAAVIALRVRSCLPLIAGFERMVVVKMSMVGAMIESIELLRSECSCSNSSGRRDGGKGVGEACRDEERWEQDGANEGGARRVEERDKRGTVRADGSTSESMGEGGSQPSRSPHFHLSLALLTLQHHLRT